jgi:hypothetical protein
VRMQTGALGVVRSLARISEALQDVRARHEAARVIVRAVVEAQVNDLLDEDGIDPLLHLTGIDVVALDDWERTWARPHSAKDGGWDWRQVALRFQKRPARVEAAVWFGEELCGLVYGRVSERREVVRIDLLKGKAEPHPLKGRIAVIAAEMGAITAQAYHPQRVRFYVTHRRRSSRHRTLCTHAQSIRPAPTSAEPFRALWDGSARALPPTMNMYNAKREAKERLAQEVSSEVVLDACDGILAAATTFLVNLEYLAGPSGATAVRPASARTPVVAEQARTMEPSRLMNEVPTVSIQCGRHRRSRLDFASVAAAEDRDRQAERSIKKPTP